MPFYEENTIQFIQRNHYVVVDDEGNNARSVFADPSSDAVIEKDRHGNATRIHGGVCEQCWTLTRNTLWVAGNNVYAVSSMDSRKRNFFKRRDLEYKGAYCVRCETAVFDKIWYSVKRVKREGHQRNYVRVEHNVAHRVYVHDLEGLSPEEQQFNPGKTWAPLPLWQSGWPAISDSCDSIALDDTVILPLWNDAFHENVPTAVMLTKEGRLHVDASLSEEAQGAQEFLLNVGMREEEVNILFREHLHHTRLQYLRNAVALAETWVELNDLQFLRVCVFGERYTNNLDIQSGLYSNSYKDDGDCWTFIRNGIFDQESDVTPSFRVLNKVLGAPARNTPSHVYVGLRHVLTVASRYLRVRYFHSLDKK